MRNILYIIGLVVVIMVVLRLAGFTKPKPRLVLLDAPDNPQNKEKPPRQKVRGFCIFKTLSEDA
jgi:hypothetical protein